jgi:hypothetical protein
MGYSLHTPCRTKKDRDQMARFLKKHYRPFSEVVAGAGCLDEYGDDAGLNDRSWKHSDWLRGPLPEDLSYIPDETKWYIGFDFGNSGGAEGSWMKDFLRWVAVKIGKRHEFSMIEGAVPYIIYDVPADEEWETLDSIWPVLDRSEYNITKDMRSYLTDGCGFRGWAQQVKLMREHSIQHTDERAVEEGWDVPRLKAEKQRRAQRFDFMLKVAKRTDQYVKKELRRLDALWEAR